MAAPTPSTRVFPVGTRLYDGYQSLIVFAADTNVSLWEMGVKAPGFDGGNPIETTTMFNTAYRTFAPRDLITLTPGTAKCAFDPQVLAQIIALENVETTISILMADHSSWCFFGYLQKFDPTDMVEGTMPSGTLTYVPTNVDPSTGNEAGPVYTAGGGTQS